MLLGAGEKDASTVATVFARVVGPQRAALPYWCWKPKPLLS